MTEKQETAVAAETKEPAKKKPTKKERNYKPEETNWVYKKLSIHLLRPQLGTCPEASIYHEHILKKAQKEIKKANKLTAKLTKALQKYKDVEEIPFQKQIEELSGIIRAYQEIVGKKEDIPQALDELLEYAKELKEECDELLKGGGAQSATVFMRDKDGWPMISTHMILGNLKENLKIVVNNSDLPKESRILASKVAVGESMALDIKPVEQFIRPSKDIVRKPDGERELLERPIVFDRQGVKTTAIAISEYLPEGTEYEVHLRCRKHSLVLEALEELFDYAKNNGLGSWRGSGNMGAYVYKLEDLSKEQADEIAIPKHLKDAGWK